MANTFTPTAREAKSLTDAANLELKKQATEDFIQEVLTQVQDDAADGLYTSEAEYDNTVDINRAIHVLTVDLDYRVTQDVQGSSIIVDWSCAPTIAPPSKNGIPIDANGAPL